MLKRGEDCPRCVRQIGKQVSTELEVGGERHERKPAGDAAFASLMLDATAESGRRAQLGC